MWLACLLWFSGFLFGVVLGLVTCGCFLVLTFVNSVGLRFLWCGSECLL